VIEAVAVVQLGGKEALRDAINNEEVKIVHGENGKKFYVIPEFVCGNKTGVASKKSLTKTRNITNAQFDDCESLLKDMKFELDMGPKQLKDHT